VLKIWLYSTQQDHVMTAGLDDHGMRIPPAAAAVFGEVNSQPWLDFSSLKINTIL
jgi:hypothetical protein